MKRVVFMVFSDDLYLNVWLSLLVIAMEEIHIDHYILGKTIGTGGFAKVKEARHDTTGVRVAIKIINKRKMKNKHMISKVKREIRILKCMNHHNIIKLYEVLDTTNDIFVIMEMAQEGQLYQYIQNHDISDQEARFFFKQIIAGLAYAHLHLITHRDLKPENILVGSKKIIKIVDFGLSNVMKDGKLLKTPCGSPNYAAPEILGERNYEGTSVDVWSCGVILYALLVGTLPFDEQTVTLLYKKVQQGIYTLPTNLDPRARDLIARMLQVDPYRRLRIHQIMNHPWLKQSVPIYVHMPSSMYSLKQQQFEFDQQIYQQVKSMDCAVMVNDEKMRKSIMERIDAQFVITYELLKDQKFRREKAKDTVKDLKSNVIPSYILKQVQNKVDERDSNHGDGSYMYGRKFTKPSKILAEIVIQALRKTNISYQIKSPQYCIKCMSVTAPSRSLKRCRTMQMTDEKQESGREMKYSKTQLKFTLQIYCIDHKGYDHIIDLQLNMGHPLVFFQTSKKLYSVIEHLCKTH